MVIGATFPGLNVRGRLWCITGPTNEAGLEQIKKLRGRLPSQPSTVISGKGQRFENMAQALDITIKTTYSVFGSEDSTEQADQKTIIKQLNQWDEGTVILADRSCLEALGVKDVKASAMYMIKGPEIILSATANESEQAEAK